MDGREKSLLKSILKKAANATRKNKNYKRPRNKESTIRFGKTPLNAGITVSMLNIPRNGVGMPVVRKSTTKRLLSNKMLKNLIIERRGSPDSTNKNDMIMAHAIADATEAYDNLDDMNLYIELRGRAERWSNNLIERIKKRLKKVYKQYDENTKRNNTVIKDTLTDIDEQFSGDIDMAIQYVEMLARMYDWTDDLKIRVIQAVEDRYA
jgi:hypothetical protein